jgi:drug/metabolite transporter (DMT)-like permease
MDANKKSVFLLYLSVVVSSFIPLFATAITQSPTVIIFGRVLFAALALFFVRIVLKERIALDRQKDYALLAGIGILLAIHWITYFHALQISSVAIGVLGGAFVPIIVTFLEPVFFKEKLKKESIVTAFVAFVGILIILPEFDIANSTVQGLGWAFISGALFALIAMLHRKYVKRYSGGQLLLYETLAASIVLVLPASVGLAPLTFPQLALIVTLGIFFTALPHALYIRSLKNLNVHSTSIITLVAIVLAVIIAAIVIQEVPEPRTIVGGLIILGAAASVSRKYLK